MKHDTYLRKYKSLFTSRVRVEIGVIVQETETGIQRKITPVQDSKD